MTTYPQIEPLLLAFFSPQEAREQAFALIHHQTELLKEQTTSLHFPLLFWNLCNPHYTGQHSLEQILAAYTTENVFPRFSDHMQPFSSEDLLEQWHILPCRTLVRFQLTLELLQRGALYDEHIKKMTHEHFTFVYHQCKKKFPELQTFLVPHILPMLQRSPSYTHFDSVYLRHNPDFAQRPMDYLPFIQGLTKDKTHHQKTLLLNSIKKDIQHTNPLVYDLLSYHILSHSQKWERFIHQRDYAMYYLHIRHKKPEFWHQLSQEQQQIITDLDSTVLLTGYSMDDVLYHRAQEQTSHLFEETPLLIS